MRLTLYFRVLEFTHEFRMFAFMSVALLLIIVQSILATHDVVFNKNGWTPIAGPFAINRMSNRNIQLREASDWKPSQNYDDMDINFDKYDEPGQSQLMETVKSDGVSLASDSDSHFMKLPLERDIKEKSITDSKQHESLTLVKVTPVDERQERKVVIKKQQRISKQLWDSSSIEDEMLDVLANSDLNVETPDTDSSISNYKISNNTYKITEPSDYPELIQETSGESNVYANTFTGYLNKYNIRANDQLNNYAKSKIRHNKIPSYYPFHFSSLPFVPSRYKSLNHRAVDPLLAVFLSNYGYYLQGFYGLPNNYKNLYGYSASNNIHNNKPFGAYKIYSDTDSSN